MPGKCSRIVRIGAEVLAAGAAARAGRAARARPARRRHPQPGPHSSGPPCTTRCPTATGRAPPRCAREPAAHARHCRRGRPAPPRPSICRPRAWRPARPGRAVGAGCRSRPSVPSRSSRSVSSIADLEERELDAGGARVDDEKGVRHGRIFPPTPASGHWTLVVASACQRRRNDRLTSQAGVAVSHCGAAARAASLADNPRGGIVRTNHTLEFQSAVAATWHFAVAVQRWGLILAGGEGVRLRPLTRAIAGHDCPKQFSAVIGLETPLERTRQRAALTIAPARTLGALTRRHE